MTIFTTNLRLLSANARLLARWLTVPCTGGAVNGPIAHHS